MLRPGSWLLMLGSNLPSGHIIEQALARLSEIGAIQTLGDVQHLPPRSGEGSWYFNALVILDGGFAEDVVRQSLRVIEQSLGRDRTTSSQVAIDIDVLARYQSGWIADRHALEKNELGQYPACKLIEDAGLTIQQEP